MSPYFIFGGTPDVAEQIGVTDQNGLQGLAFLHNHHEEGRT